MGSPEAPSVFSRFEHLVYLGVIQGVGAAVLDAGINFGIATAMYRGSSTPASVWVIPGSLAGDAAVTIMVQVTLTWIIAGCLAARDSKGGRLTPLKIAASSSPWPLVLWSSGDFDFVAPQIPGKPSRLLRFSLSALRGFVFAAATGVVFWPLSVAFLLAQFGGSQTIPDWPEPQIFKGVLGGLLGLVTTPLVAFLSLMKASQEKEASVADEEIAVDGVGQCEKAEKEIPC